MSAKQTATSSFEVYQQDDTSASQYSSELVSEKGGRSNFFSRFINWVEIDGTRGLSMSQLFLYNYDLKPVEAARRTWRWYSFCFFWIADSFNVNTWQIAATGIEAGMSVWQTWGTIWLGYFFCGCFVTIAARVGTYYHVSFPVSCRSSFGIWGSLFPVLNRVFMAMVWFGVQSAIGGQCVQLMLRSVFGNDLDTKIPNKLGTSGNITSFGLLSFFLFWLFQLPFIYMKPHVVRHLFTVKAAICPIAGIGFLIWTLIKADGGGPVIRRKSTLHGSALAWAFISSMMNSLSNFATVIVNAPDFSRMAHGKQSAVWSQFLTLPISFSLTCLIGILVSSASTILYGQTYWNPLDVLSRFLDHYSSGARTGVFFISFGFSLAQLGTNISANSLSAGTDMTALLPKFINIRRGGFICAAVGFAICPWNLLSSSSMFTTYLSAYSTFLSAIAGTVFCDYFILKKGYLRLKELYLADDSSAYYYSRGVNWRAYAAYICGILPNIVGFVGATQTHKVPEGATKLYYFNFFAGYISSVASLLVLSMIFPVKGLPCKVFERKWFEEWQNVEDFDQFFDTQLRSARTSEDGGEKEERASSRESIKEVC
ncbi:DEKNAAC103818 [Brettanomyces naardenensis]|uniref:DEKNAAC103818 n=1 Tax=Brettanomyces naardenensis TaxID=13370 RepID=A0A448YP94_BRENA|nr:DEKNAAC103818 [Brettanomyces naardenensis]